MNLRKFIPEFFSFFESMDIEVCPRLLRHESEFRSKENLRILFLLTDKEHHIKTKPNEIILRTSGRASKIKKTENHFVLPYFFESLNEPYKPLKKEGARPKVGFCGQHGWVPQRMQAIEQLDKNKLIDQDIILRNAFWGGDPHGKQVKKDFLDNIERNHFNLCCRGHGNFSMRFYQVLSAGRIPAFINSDMPLPLDDLVDYNEFCIIAENSIHLSDLILQAWKNNDIEKMQQKAADFYHTMISHKTYHKHLIKDPRFINILKKYNKI